MNDAIAVDEAVKTYRGESIESLLPQIRAELGPDAVIVSRREGLIGGMGGFFQKRCVEVDARAGGARVDVYDEAPIDEGSAGARGLPEEGQAPAGEDVGGPGVLSQGERPAGGAVAPFSASPPVPPPGGAAAEDEQTYIVRNDSATREGLATPAVQELVGQARPFAEMLEAADPQPSTALEVEPEPVPEEPLGPPRAELLRQGMTASGLGEDIAGEVVDSVLANAMPFVNSGRLRTLVRNQLALRIPVALAAEPGQRTIAFVGPAGAGKTAAIAAIAAAHVARGTPAACLALDSSDNGAALEALLAGTAVRVVALRSSELAATPLHNRDGGLLLIDTPPLWSGAERLGKTARKIRATKPAEVHLVMRAGTAAAAGAELLEGLAALRPNRLLLTGAAETSHLGGVLDVAVRSGIPLGYVAENPREIALADPRDLAGRITP